MTVAAGGASAAAIRHHYDLHRGYYELWLDPSLTYSGARFAEGASLEDAQAAKLHLLLGWAGVGPATRLLDIGCGWGAALFTAVRDLGATEAVGLTLSPDQAGYVDGKGVPGVAVRLESWADHQPPSPYDAAISVGAFEHFARPGLPSRQKVEIYRAFFDRVRAALVPGGRLALQTISVGDHPMARDDLLDLLFIWRAVFPQSSLPTLVEIAAGCRGLFEVEAMRNDRSDYVTTLDAWLGRLASRRAEAVGLVGEDVVVRYERYMQAARRMFANGQCNLLRFRLASVAGHPGSS
jgi:cyclopropane-fatty-acyl-phospholipid synthase